VLRERLLNLAYAFARLDESVREKYADAKSRYRFESAPFTYHRLIIFSFGWSHGKVRVGVVCSTCTLRSDARSRKS